MQFKNVSCAKCKFYRSNLKFGLDDKILMDYCDLYENKESMIPLIPCNIKEIFNGTCEFFEEK
jgi:hypothetical protein